jgi:hypothetical protein
MRAGLALAVLLGALLAAPAARAGSYQVVACDRAVGGGAAPSWTPAANAGWTPSNQCPVTGLVGSVPTTPGDKGWLENASWDFIAPAGTRLGTLTADVSIARPGSDVWTIAVVAYDDNVLVPEWRNYGCYSQQPCTVPAGYQHVTLDFGGLFGARITAACWGANPCSADSQGGRFAMRNASMTVLDDSRPGLSVGGPLWIDGAHLRTDEALVDASDNVGIRSISLLVDGVQKAITASDCQATQRVPCPNVDDGPLSLAGTDVADGVHTITVRATDSAGNTTDAVRNVQIVTPPATRLTAGAAHRHGRAAKRPHVSVRHSVLVRGRLTFASGTPLAGQPIQVFATQLRTGASRQPIGATQTDATGRFSFRIPPGPARLVRFSYAGDPASAGGSAAAISVRVPASTTIHAKPRRVRLHHSVALSGRLRLAGAENPRPGKLVILQAFERGRWHTVATTRSRPSGTWHRAIRFDARPGTYRLRALIRRERGFPFVTGTSRAARVTVVP